MVTITAKCDICDTSATWNEHTGFRLGNLKRFYAVHFECGEIDKETADELIALQKECDEAHLPGDCVLCGAEQ